MNQNAESIACSPQPVENQDFNPAAHLPYGCKAQHIQLAMNEFIDFLRFVNEQLYEKKIPRLESMLMPANFSSMVSEFMNANIPKYCPGLVKNLYHNGHPDLLPAGIFPEDAVQYADEGIEVKASRYSRGWQGHNPEDSWLLVFVFESNRPIDASKGIDPMPFRFLMVLGASLTKDDWRFSGRSGTSRRTITASVANSGYEKMMENWIYKAPDLQ